ncbi:MAG: aminopeptidase P family protein [Clostridiales bacterium]|nr:aminopeptidase P family protein [Clostridiales bacterium]
MDRIQKLISRLPDNIDMAIITSDVSRRYFTGMKSSAGTLVVFKEKAYLIIDFRYIEKAMKTVVDCDVLLQEKTYEQINKLMKKHNAKTFSIESEYMSVSHMNTFKEKICGEIIVDNTLSSIISELRIIKTDDEMEKISTAQKIAEKAFNEILSFIAVGKTEREIALALNFEMLKCGAEALSFETIALSGANTSLPHGVPTEKTVNNGDFVLMDFGAVYEGYHSDMTRTVAVGKPSEKMKLVYDIVLNAQMVALSQAKSGITGSQLDEYARDIICKNGFKDNFGHSLGHGVGMEIHELPNASPYSETRLEENMVVTIEPGIYLPNEFGVRIEDFIVIKNDGCKNLTTAPKNLICI